MMADPRNEIQRRSRSLEILATVVFFVLILTLMLEATAIPRADDLAAAAKFSLIFRLPVFFYLLAIWMIRRAFAALAKGAMFGDVVPRLLTWIGFALSAGAFTTVFVVPLLHRISFGGEAGSIANFDPAAILLGIVGLLLVVLARLLVQAAKIHAELQEFF